MWICKKQWCVDVKITDIHQSSKGTWPWKEAGEAEVECLHLESDFGTMFRNRLQGDFWIQCQKHTERLF